jgi:hypothetical protein
MKFADIAPLRLHFQYLSDPIFTNPSEVVHHLGAVQAQDYAAAKWSIGQRMKNGVEAAVEEAYNQGSILRTHVMRPTWHFVLPEDIRWMLELTSPQVRKKLAHYDRKLAITEELRSRTKKVFTTALRNNNYLTRTELAKHLLDHGIDAHGQLLNHIVMHAELDGLICSGPRRGKQFTYALLEERVAPAKTMGREEALGTLALKYFTSHGPAQLSDFSWWSGLSVRDSTTALELIKSQLEQDTIEGKVHFFVSARKSPKVKDSKAFLISVFDEYTIAYTDRTALGQGEYFNQLLSSGSLLLSVVILDGQLVGTWKRVLQKKQVLINVRLFKRANTQEMTAIRAAAEKYGQFLGLTPSLSCDNSPDDTSP